MKQILNVIDWISEDKPIIHGPYWCINGKSFDMNDPLFYEKILEEMEISIRKFYKYKNKK